MLSISSFVPSSNWLFTLMLIEKESEAPGELQGPTLEQAAYQVQEIEVGTLIPHPAPCSQSIAYCCCGVSTLPLTI